MLNLRDSIINLYVLAAVDLIYVNSFTLSRRFFCVCCVNIKIGFALVKI